MLWLFIDVGIIIMLATNVVADNPEILLFLIPFFLLHMAPVWIFIGGIIKAAIDVNSVLYVITNKRILSIRGHFKYTDYSINLDDIVDVQYKRSSLDKFFRVADIYITAKNNKNVMFDIPNGAFIYDKLSELLRIKKEEAESFYKDGFTCDHCGSQYGMDMTKCPNCCAPKKKSE